MDTHQRISQWSTEAQQLLSFRPEDVVGELCYEIIGGRDSRNYRFCRRDCPASVNARRGRTTASYDILSSMPTGEEKWVNVSIIAPQKSGRYRQIYHLVRDVSDRRRTEEFARRISAAL